MVGEKVGNEGLEWKACQVTNTELDFNCGLASLDDALIVAAHNPSTVKQDMLRLQAPAGEAFLTYVLDKDSQTWSKVASDLICFDATKDTPEA